MSVIKVKCAGLCCKNHFLVIFLGVGKLKNISDGIREIFTIHTKDGPRLFLNLKENVSELVETFAPGVWDFYEDKIEPIIEERRAEKSHKLCKMVGCDRAEEHSVKFLDCYDASGKKAAYKMINDLHDLEMKNVTD